MKVARILVVDDEPQLRRVMKAALAKQGYIVGDARSGEAALEKIREERYDLIILDRNMPGMGGVEACRSIREHSDVGIIMLTIRKEEPDRIEAWTQVPMTTLQNPSACLNCWHASEPLYGAPRWRLDRALNESHSTGLPWIWTATTSQQTVRMSV